MKSLRQDGGIATLRNILNRYEVESIGFTPTDNTATRKVRNRELLIEDLTTLNLDDLCVLRELIRTDAKLHGKGGDATLARKDLEFAKTNVEAAIRERSGGGIKAETFVGNLTIIARAFGRSAANLVGLGTAPAEKAHSVEKAGSGKELG